MTKLGAIITLSVVLALGGMGYLAYLKANPSAEPSAVEGWIRSAKVRKVLPGLFFAVFGGVVVAAVVGGYRHHKRGDEVWSKFAAQLGMPCKNAGFFSGDSSRVEGELEGRVFLLETRIVQTRGSGNQRGSSTRTDMKLQLAGAPAELTLSSGLMGSGSGFLGRMAQGVADRLVEASGVGQYEVRTGDERFDKASRAFCPDPDSARTWLEPRTGVLLEYLGHQGNKLEKGYLVHSSSGKTSSPEDLDTRLTCLASFAKRLEVEA